MERKKLLIFDGAFGTYYHKTGKPELRCELANLYDKDTVLRIHNEYISAGANTILTNTFGANSGLSADFTEIRKILRVGYAIANEAAKGKGVRVFADMGPLPPLEEGQASHEYLRLAGEFLGVGARDFLFETLADVQDILPAVRLIRKRAPESTVAVSFAVSQDGYTNLGLSYHHLIPLAAEGGADLVGLNCVCGPTHMLQLLKKLDLRQFPVLAMPNAGYPALENGRLEYRDNPEYFAGKLAEIAALGVDAVGGCCGTTPEHLREAVLRMGIAPSAPAMLASIKTSRSSLSSHSTDSPFDHPPDDSFVESPPEGIPSPQGRPLIAVELDPPADTSCDYLISAARLARASGADMITVADSPMARTRADSVILAAKIRREAGIDVMPHIACRDRNQIAIKGLLLGAGIEGIHRVLAVTGDPMPQNERDPVKGVFFFNSQKLIAFIRSLNEEVFAGAPFEIAGALNINVRNFDTELRRAQKKLELGATMLLTQPIFSKRNFENYFKAREQLNCTLLAGILPVANYRNALFLNNEVAGIEIPAEVVERFRDKSPEDAKAVSVSFCRDIIDRLGPDCDGYYLMTPLKKIDYVCEVTEYIRKNRT